jgi:hypothetical protein
MIWYMFLWRTDNEKVTTSTWKKKPCIFCHDLLLSWPCQISNWRYQLSCPWSAKFMADQGQPLLTSSNKVFEELVVACITLC